MTVTEPLLLPHVDALITRAETTGLPIGDHVAPKSSDGSFVAPSAVLYLRPGGTISGTLADPYVDAWLPFQFTCVGRVGREAIDVADALHTALTGSPLTVDDRTIVRVRRTYFGATAQRDDDVTPPLFYVPAEYRLWTISTPEESS